MRNTEKTRADISLALALAYGELKALVDQHEIKSFTIDGISEKDGVYTVECTTTHEVEMITFEVMLE